MDRSVICLVKDEGSAERVANELHHAGFSPDQISALFPDNQGTRDFAHDQDTIAPTDAATGAGAGGLLGGSLGWLAGIGSLAIPGLGPFIAAGPILAALAGAAAGAAVGGLTGALHGLGIPEYDAKEYEGKIKEGNILISVHTDDVEELELAEEIFEKAGAESIRSTGEPSTPV
jgi:hypothetical protein